MLLFWLLAALMILVTLALVVPPLMRGEAGGAGGAGGGSEVGKGEGTGGGGGGDRAGEAERVRGGDGEIGAGPRGQAADGTDGGDGAGGSGKGEGTGGDDRAAEVDRAGGAEREIGAGSRGQAADGTDGGDGVGEAERAGGTDGEVGAGSRGQAGDGTDGGGWVGGGGGAGGSGGLAAPGDANIALYRERLAELDRERDRGEVDEARYAALREDLHRGLLADVDTDRPPAVMQTRPPRLWMAGAVAVLVSVGGLAFYLRVGSPHRIDAPPPSPPVAQAGVGTPPAVEAMVASLAARLAKDPNDAEGWMFLARSQVVLERFDAALVAFERAHALVGDRPSLLSDWAETEAAVADNRFPASAAARLDRALELDPGHEKALWLGGFAAFQHGRPDVALERWEQLLAQQVPGSREASILSGLLERVRDAPQAPSASGLEPGSLARPGDLAGQE